MSVYSSKCDLCDHFWMRANTEEDIEKEIARTDFYIWSENGRKHRLDIHSIKDLAPYYPYLIAVACGSKEGRNMIILSSESFVDQEERDFMSWDLRDAIKEYKRCKRKKIPFDPDAYYEKFVSTWRSEHNYTKEIIDRVAKYGEKANLDGLYSETKDRWDRARLAQELERLGYDDWFINHWVFGYRKEYPNWREEN